MSTHEKVTGLVDSSSPDILPTNIYIILFPPLTALIIVTIIIIIIIYMAAGGLFQLNINCIYTREQITDGIFFFLE